MQRLTLLFVFYLIYYIFHVIVKNYEWFGLRTRLLLAKIMLYIISLIEMILALVIHQEIFPEVCEGPEEYIIVWVLGVMCGYSFAGIVFERKLYVEFILEKIENEVKKNGITGETNLDS